MKNFSVTYRDNDGRQQAVQISAEDRNSLFEELARRGISAIRVEEASGKAKPRKQTPASKSSNGVFKGIVAGAIVIIAGLVVFVVMRPSVQDEERSEQPKKPKESVTEVAPPAPSPVRTEQVEEKPKPEPKEPTLRQQMMGLSEDEKLDMLEKKLAETPIPKESTNRTFRTGLEQVMGWVFTTELGDAPPPLPNLSNFDLVHIEEILNMTNPVRDTDSDKAADAKETVDFVKKELKKYLEKGGAPQEFLAFYHAELKQAYQERQMVQRQAMQLLREEPDLVFDFLDKANEGLAAKGIKKAVIPKRVLLRYGLSDE